MQKVRLLKDKLIAPLIKLFASLKIKPYHLTLIGGVFGLLSLYFIFNNNILALILFILWRVFDILDGSLARYTNNLNWWADNFTDRSIFSLFLLKIYLVFDINWALVVFLIYVAINAIFFLQKRFKFIYKAKENFMFMDTVSILLLYFSFLNLSLFLFFLFSIYNLIILFCYLIKG